MSRAVLEADAVVSGLKDMAMMSEAVEQCSGHLGVAKDAGASAVAGAFGTQVTAEEQAAYVQAAVTVGTVVGVVVTLVGRWRARKPIAD